MNKRLFLVIALVACEPGPKNMTSPEAAAKKFATDLGLKLSGEPSCTGVDTDDDGYVTCTIATTNGDGLPSLMSIQCAALNDPTGCDSSKGSKFATGCKQTLMVPRL